MFTSWLYYWNWAFNIYRQSCFDFDRSISWASRALIFTFPLQNMNFWSNIWSTAMLGLCMAIMYVIAVCLNLAGFCHCLQVGCFHICSIIDNRWVSLRPWIFHQHASLHSRWQCHQAPACIRQHQVLPRSARREHHPTERVLHMPP